MTLDEYFSTGPERERPIYEAVKAHLDTLGPVHRGAGVGRHLPQAAPVASRSCAPPTKWVDLTLSLGQPVRDDARIVRKPACVQRAVVPRRRA